MTQLLKAGAGANSPKYIPVRQAHGYPAALRRQAVQLYVDDMNFRRIARQLGVNHQTVVNRVNAASTLSVPTPLPVTVEIVKLDELSTFVGAKKS